MLKSEIQMPLWKVMLVLIGFPLVSTLISLMLLHRNMFSATGLGFFSVFWLIITLWYALQIMIVKQFLGSEGYTLAQIGFSFKSRKTFWLIFAYLVFATLLIVFVEMALRQRNGAASHLSDFANLSPVSLEQRIIFVIMGLLAGLAEEIVYRGFAIHSLMGYKINPWLAILFAAIPFVFQHGLKSIPQFSWFFSMGIVFGLLYVVFKRLSLNIVIHWLIILSAIMAVLS